MVPIEGLLSITKVVSRLRAEPELKMPSGKGCNPVRMSWRVAKLEGSKEGVSWPAGAVPEPVMSRV